MVLMIGVSALLFIYFVLVAWRTNSLLTPDGLFVLFNTIGLIGTLFVVHMGADTEKKYLLVVFCGTSLFTALAVGARIALGRRKSRIEIPVRATRISTSLVLLYALSLTISLAYYFAIGRITLVEAFVTSSSGQYYDVTTSRLENYSGSSYFSPGYVNQFKNVVLPICTAAIVHTLWSERARGRAIFSVALVFVAFVMVAGTGQRGALVITFLTVGSAVGLGGLLRPQRILTLGTLGLSGFILVTFLLQRQAGQATNADTLWGRFYVYAEALWNRVVMENPYSGLAAFHVTEREPTVWGRQWASEVVDLLPGQGGQSLANRVFAYLYGTDRGTAPESIWGGIYYNFGWFGGTVVVVALFGLMRILTTSLFLVPESTPRVSFNFLAVLSLSGMAVTLGSWVVGSPVTVANTGFFAYVLLYLYSRKARSGPPPGPWTQIEIDNPEYDGNAETGQSVEYDRPDPVRRAGRSQVGMPGGRGR